MKRKIVAILCASVLLTGSFVGCSGTGTPASEIVPESESEIVTSEPVSEEPEEVYLGHDYLKEQLAENSQVFLEFGTDIISFYKEIGSPEGETEFPESFDLRDKNLIPEVKDQSPWGTCWSFATMSSCESSILSILGLTLEEYKEKYGETPDFSEKHLSYFGNTPMPDADQYEEGEYPYDINQAGEGVYLLSDEETPILNGGGNYLEATSALASGIGLRSEKEFPYRDADGKMEYDGDWSIPENERFGSIYALKNTNALPNPAMRDKANNYIYNPFGTEAIKSELMKGRAVGIAYHADQSMPAPSKEEIDAAIDYFIGVFPELELEDVQKYMYYKNNVDAAASKEYSDDELREMLKIRLHINEMPEDTYDIDSLTTEQLKLLLISYALGEKLEDIPAQDTKAYLNFTGEEDSVWAQYTYEIRAVNHAVTIVGWDDHFSKDNFLADHKPPEDGAWIVRNSWGSDWGMDGYFYLSYYDQNICVPLTFEFYTEEELAEAVAAGSGADEEVADSEAGKEVADSEAGKEVADSEAGKEVADLGSEIILQKDFMPAEMYNSTLFIKPVYTANIFDAEGGLDLYSVSALTGDLNTEVTVDVYRLKDGFADPTDGEKVASVTDTFTFAGYHRLLLKEKLHFEEGEKLSIVVKESVMTEEGEKFAIVNTTALGKDGADRFTKEHEGSELKISKYVYGIVNPGESFVAYEDGEWHDWAKEVETFSKEDENIGYVSFDNLPIKGYAVKCEDAQ